MFKVVVISLNMILSVDGQDKAYDYSYAFNIDATQNFDCDAVSEKSALKSQKQMLDAFDAVGTKVSIKEFNFVGVCNG